MASMLKSRRPTETKDFENGLGWQVSSVNGREIVQKDGATFGGEYASFIAFDPNARVGVVVLANAYAPTGVSDIGLHLLDPRFPLRGMHQREVAVDPAVLDAYVGRYRLSPNVVITVSRNGSRMFAQMTGQPQYEIFPANDRTFFYKSFDAQLVFATDASGRASSVRAYYGAKSSRAERIEPSGNAK
jgi:CubicO group peptidase (beta-lactamase class C family)